MAKNTRNKNEQWLYLSAPCGVQEPGIVEQRCRFPTKCTALEPEIPKPSTRDTTASQAVTTLLLASLNPLLYKYT